MFEDIEEVFDDRKGFVVNPESMGAGFEDSEIFAIIKRIGLIELHSKIDAALNRNGHILIFPDFIAFFVFAGYYDFIRP